MTCEPGAAAALSVIEALLLALAEKGVLPDDEIASPLSDAASPHVNAAQSGPDFEAARHRAAAALIERMRDRSDSVRAWTGRPSDGGE